MIAGSSDFFVLVQMVRAEGTVVFFGLFLDCFVWGLVSFAFSLSWELSFLWLDKNCILHKNTILMTNMTGAVNKTDFLALFSCGLSFACIREISISAEF